MGGVPRTGTQRHAAASCVSTRSLTALLLVAGTLSIVANHRRAAHVANFQFDVPELRQDARSMDVGGDEGQSASISLKGMHEFLYSVRAINPFVFYSVLCLLLWVFMRSFPTSL